MTGAMMNQTTIDVMIINLVRGTITLTSEISMRELERTREMVTIILVITLPQKIEKETAPTVLRVTGYHLFEKALMSRVDLKECVLPTPLLKVTGDQSQVMELEDSQTPFSLKCLTPHPQEPNVNL